MMKKDSNRSGPRKPKDSREGGWVKKDRVWRSEKAQKTARGESGFSRRDKDPGHLGLSKKGAGGKDRHESGWAKKDRAWRSEKAQKTERGESGFSRQDKDLEHIALSKKGAGGYDNYVDIPAHQIGRKLRKRLYQIANRLPEEENHNLKSRIKYAATTVTAALAQGFGEGAFRSGINHALQSRGALVEVQDHLDQLIDLEMLPEEEGIQLKQEVDRVIQAVNDFMGRLVKERNRS
jgi:four helix bundle protein